MRAFVNVPIVKQFSDVYGLFGDFFIPAFGVYFSVGIIFAVFFIVPRLSHVAKPILIALADQLGQAEQQ